MRKNGETARRFLLVLTASAVAAMGCAEREPVPALPPAGVARGIPLDTLAEGRRIFLGEGNCSACHGTDARGTRFAPDLRDAEWEHASGEAEDIARVVSNGIPAMGEWPSPMPPMGGARLTAEEIHAVAVYTAALGGSAVRRPDG